MKSRFFQNNPQFDFFLKNYLVHVLCAFLTFYIWPKLFYFIDRNSWESPLGGGWLMYYTLGFYSILILYPILLIFSFLFILVFNNKLMSGRKINKKTKFALFLLSIFFYALTLVVVTFVYSLF